MQSSQMQSSQMQSSQVKPVSRAEERPGILPLSFHGKGGTLFGIQIVNLFLTLITLGVYYFWAKVRVRKYLWSQVDLGGDRLAYHGTPREALMGWLKAMLVFGVPFLVFQNLPALVGANGFVIFLCAIISLVLIAVFIPVAVVGMRRYRFSRTSLRGLRFSFRGRWRAFARIFYSSFLYKILTLGLYSPYYDVRKTAFFFENTYYGNKRFGFHGRGSDLLGKYIIALLLALPTLSLSLLWYSMEKTRYLWNHTSFQGSSFQSAITFSGVLWLMLSSLLLLVCTLGLGAPWVQVRVFRYYLGNLRLMRSPDFAAIAQDARDDTATAEEIGDFLDMDFDLG